MTTCNVASHGGTAVPVLALPVGARTLSIEPASARRAWMDRTPQRFAYRCLPMVLANQHGWVLCTRYRVSTCWDGTEGVDGLVVHTDHDRDAGWVSSHFGCGILTWTVPFLFRTPPGVELLLRGPSNTPVDGASPLEGLVETDWSPATATMNWQLTRPHYEVVFEPGDPVGMVVPIRRALIESCVPAIGSNDALEGAYRNWRGRRESFLADLQGRTGPDSWQRDYQRGRIGSSGATQTGHRSRLAIKCFEE